MEIIASSAQKAGELFLHAGYSSAFQGFGSADGFFAGVVIMGGAFLVSLFFEKWINRMIVVLAGLLLIRLVTGCSELQGDP